MLHNSHLGLRGMEELHDWAKFFADCIVPQEYGVDRVSMFVWIDGVQTYGACSGDVHAAVPCVWLL